jgi:hypothetical protein
VEEFSANSIFSISRIQKRKTAGRMPAKWAVVSTVKTNWQISSYPSLFKSYNVLF